MPPTLRGKIELDSTGALNALRSIERTLVRWSASFDRQLSRVSSRWSAFTSSLSKAIAPLRRAVMALSAAFVASGAAIVYQAAKFQDLRAGLDAITGDAAKSKRIWAEVFDLFVKSPMDLEPLIRMRTLLEGVGISGSKAMHAVAEGAAALGRPVEDIASALVSLETEPLRRLGIMLKSADGTYTFGFTTKDGQAMTHVAQGIEAARAAMVEIMGMKFGGSLEARARTLNGAFSTTLGTLKAILAALGSDVVRVFADRLAGLNAKLLALLSGTQIDAFAARLGKLAEQAIKVGEALVGALGGDDLAGKAAAAWDMLASVAVKAVGIIVGGLGWLRRNLELVAALMVANFALPVAAAFVKLGAAVTSVAWSVVVPALSGMVKMAMSTAASLVSAFQLAGEGMQTMMVLSGMATLSAMTLLSAVERGSKDAEVAMEVLTNAIVMQVAAWAAYGAQARNTTKSVMGMAVAMRAMSDGAIANTTTFKAMGLAGSLSYTALAVAVAIAGYKVGRFMWDWINQYEAVGHWTSVVYERTIQLWELLATVAKEGFKAATGQESALFAKVGEINARYRERIRILDEMRDKEREAKGLDALKAPKSETEKATDDAMATFEAELAKLKTMLLSGAPGGKSDDSLEDMFTPNKGGGAAADLGAAMKFGLPDSEQATWRQRVASLLDKVSLNTEATAENTRPQQLVGFRTGAFFKGVGHMPGAGAQAPAAPTMFQQEEARQFWNVVFDKAVPAALGLKDKIVGVVESVRQANRNAAARPAAEWLSEHVMRAASGALPALEKIVAMFGKADKADKADPDIGKQIAEFLAAEPKKGGPRTDLERQIAEFLKAPASDAPRTVEEGRIAAFISGYGSKDVGKKPVSYIGAALPAVSANAIVGGATGALRQRVEPPGADAIRRANEAKMIKALNSIDANTKNNVGVSFAN